MLKTNKHIDDIINKINKKISILEHAEEVQRQYDADPYNVDWSIIYKNASYIDFIRKSQDFFSFDLDENFYPYPSYYIRNICIQKIYLPVIEYGPVRLYITNDNGLNVPFFLNKKYNRTILKQFGFSESQTDNILFFINEHKDLIDKKIKSGSVSYEDWLSVFDGQFNLSDFIYNNIIVESKFEIKCGKYSRLLWLQANQNVSHAPRIKVQDRKDKTKSKDFGYIEAHGDFDECYCIDNDLSNDEKKLIRAFVQVNEENIRKTFYPKFKDWTFDKFIREMVHVDLNGNPIEKSIQEQTPDVLLSAGKITMDDVVFVDANKTGKNDFTIIKFDDTHLNLYHPDYGICFNRWFKVIFPFDRNDMNIYKFKVLTYDDEIIEVDLNGNLLQKL